MASFVDAVQVGRRLVGRDQPTFVVAELSGNHGGDLDRALALIDAAAEAGADAVKIQTYRADTLTIDSDEPSFRIGGGTLWDGRTLYELYEEAATPWEWTQALFERAAAHRLDAFSTPFDESALDYLEGFSPPAHKVASFELVDVELIGAIARTGRPMILSTGMATKEEIDLAVQTARNVGCEQLVLLHCVSAYPAPVAEMNLRTIPDLQATFGVPVGLSDHSLTSTAAVAAVALGACVVEKHLTLDRGEGGPDAAFSLEPQEFADLVRAIRDCEAAVGDVSYGPAEHEQSSMAFRRSLFAVSDIAPGEEFTRSNVRSIRPGNGLPPRDLPAVLGRRATRAIDRGTPLDWSQIEPAGGKAL